PSARGLRPAVSVIPSRSWVEVGNGDRRGCSSRKRRLTEGKAAPDASADLSRLGRRAERLPARTALVRLPRDGPLPPRAVFRPVADTAWKRSRERVPFVVGEHDGAVRSAQ